MTSHRPPGLSGNWGNEAKDLHVCWLLRGRKRRTQGLSFTQGRARGSSKGQELPQRHDAQPSLARLTRGLCGPGQGSQLRGLCTPEAIMSVWAGEPSA